jgi:hypothetical protein
MSVLLMDRQPEEKVPACLFQQRRHCMRIPYGVNGIPRNAAIPVRSGAATGDDRDNNQDEYPENPAESLPSLSGRIAACTPEFIRTAIAV